VPHVPLSGTHWEIVVPPVLMSTHEKPLGHEPVREQSYPQKTSPVSVLRRQ
jgi:hypothetical protein